MPKPGTRDDMLAALISDMDRRLRELEAPGGTQRAQTMGDLIGRTVHTVTVPTVTATASTTNPSWVSSEFALPAPRGGSRSALFVFNGPLSGSGEPAQAFVEVRRLGGLLIGGSGNVNGGASRPAGWSEMVAGAVPLIVPAGEDPVFQVRVAALKFTSPTALASVSGATAALIYGDRT